MSGAIDSIDLGRMRLASGEGRTLEVAIPLGPFELGGQRYVPVPDVVPARLGISRTTGGGHALALRFEATLTGACMRCLEDASPRFEIDVREVSQPGSGEELCSPYVDAGVLDLSGWAHDSLALALPATVLCEADCAGLCAVCGVALRAAGPEHSHDPEPDPRWAKLAELKFD